VRSSQAHASLPQRRVLGRLHELPSLVGAAHVGQHDPQGAQVQAAGDEVAGQTGDADHGRQAHLAAGDQDRPQRLQREAGMLQVEQEEVGRQRADESGDVGDGELHHHMAHHQALLVQRLSQGVRLHHGIPPKRASLARKAGWSSTGRLTM